MNDELLDVLKRAIGFLDLLGHEEQARKLGAEARALLTASASACASVEQEPVTRMESSSEHIARVDDIEYAIQVLRQVEDGDAVFVGQCADAIQGLENVIRGLEPIASPSAERRGTDRCFFCGKPLHGKHEADCPQAENRGDAEQIVANWIKSRGTSMNGEAYAAAVELVAFAQYQAENRSEEAAQDDVRDAIRRLHKNEAEGDAVFICGFNAGLNAAVAAIASQSAKEPKNG